MRSRDYTILARAVEEGVAAGWRRAHKHTGKPPEDHVRAEIEAAVMGEISEVFAFDETSGDAVHDFQSSGGDRCDRAPSLSSFDVPPGRGSGVPGRIRGPRARGVSRK